MSCTSLLPLAREGRCLSSEWKTHPPARALHLASRTHHAHSDTAWTTHFPTATLTSNLPSYTSSPFLCLPPATPTVPVHSNALAVPGSHNLRRNPESSGKDSQASVWGPAQQCVGPDGVDHLQLYQWEYDLESKSMGLFGALSCHEGISPRPAFLVQGFRNGGQA